MARRFALLLSTIAGTFISGAYWFAFFVAYGLTMGDYRPGTGPSDTQRSLTSLAVWAGGFIGYAVIAWVWRAIDFRLAKRGRPSGPGHSVTSARALTEGEIDAARSIFGDAIDYPRVRVHCGKYVFFQPSNTAMAPNGEIYFPEPVYKADFATNIDDRTWIIHELTHVWQHQHGVNLILRAPFSRKYTYGALEPASKFAAFNIEQQATCTADCYLLRNDRLPQYGSGTVEQYGAILPYHM